MPDLSPTLGHSLIAITTFLSAQLLVLRIRDHFKEKPDPKLTYSTLKQFEQLHSQLLNHENQIKADLQSLRLEFKNDNQIRDASFLKSSQTIHQQISNVSSKLASVATQTQVNFKTISQLSKKTDKLLRNLSSKL